MICIHPDPVALPWLTIDKSAASTTSARRNTRQAARKGRAIHPSPHAARFLRPMVLRKRGQRKLKSTALPQRLSRGYSCDGARKNRHAYERWQQPVPAEGRWSHGRCSSQQQLHKSAAESCSGTGVRKMRQPDDRQSSSEKYGKLHSYTVHGDVGPQQTQSRPEIQATTKEIWTLQDQQAKITEHADS